MIRHQLRGIAVACALATVILLPALPAQAETRTLSFKQMHTGETLTVVYKRNGRYVPAGLKKINYILRDWRRNEATEMDPRLLDVIWEAHRLTGSRAPIHVLSGYRSPVTNKMLRKTSSGVAKNSQHKHGKALDFYLPDVPLSKLRAVALKMQRGGVGFYPTSGSPFVHLDTGSVRHWPRMSHQQLAKLFPDGETVHIPSDGKPLKGYQVAKAEIAARRSGGRSTTVASRSNDGPLFSGGRDGYAVASASTGSGGGLLGRLFGRDREEAASTAVASATSAPQKRAPEPVPITILADAPLPPPRPGAGMALAVAEVPLPEPRPFALAALAPSADEDVPLPPASPIVSAALAPAILPPTRPTSEADAEGRLSTGAMEALMALAPATAREEELPFAATFNDAGTPPAEQGLIAIDLRPEAIDPYVVAADCRRGPRMARFRHPDQSNLSGLMTSVEVIVENRFDHAPDEITHEAFTGPAVARIATRDYGPDLRADVGGFFTGSLN